MMDKKFYPVIDLRKYVNNTPGTFLNWYPFTQRGIFEFPLSLSILGERAEQALACSASAQNKLWRARHVCRTNFGVLGKCAEQT